MKGIQSKFNGLKVQQYKETQALKSGLLVNLRVVKEKSSDLPASPSPTVKTVEAARTAWIQTTLTLSGPAWYLRALFSYLHSTDSLAVKVQLQTEITTKIFLCNPNAFCWPRLPTEIGAGGSISYALWKPVHSLFPPTFSNYYLLQLHLNNVAMCCHVIHFAKPNYKASPKQCSYILHPVQPNQTMKSSVIDHPYLAKSHLQTEAGTNTYRNKLLHPVKLTTAAQSSLNPITQLYLLSPFPHPTQQNNTC